MSEYPLVSVVYTVYGRINYDSIIQIWSAGVRHRGTVSYMQCDMYTKHDNSPVCDQFIHITEIQLADIRSVSS